MVIMKIIMIFTLGKYSCPAGTQYCADWDYTVQNFLMTKTGDTVELGRLITPYANTSYARFPMTWKQRYTYDVTDLYSLLKGSAAIRIHYSGYSGGFTANITFAFIEGKPKKLTCIDIVHPTTYVPQGGVQSFEKVLQECKDKEIDFKFIEASSLDIEIEPTDLLFIDTLHTGEQLQQELFLHSDKAKKYIVLHDTVSYETELMPVINTFLEQGVWKVKEHYKNNNGCMILERC